MCLCAVIRACLLLVGPGRLLSVQFSGEEKCVCLDWLIDPVVMFMCSCAKRNVANERDVRAGRVRLGAGAGKNVDPVIVWVVVCMICDICLWKKMGNRCSSIRY